MIKPISEISKIQITSGTAAVVSAHITLISIVSHALKNSLSCRESLYFTKHFILSTPAGRFLFGIFVLAVLLYSGAYLASQMNMNEYSKTQKKIYNMLDNEVFDNKLTEEEML